MTTNPCDKEHAKNNYEYVSPFLKTTKHACLHSLRGSYTNNALRVLKHFKAVLFYTYHTKWGRPRAAARPKTRKVLTLTHLFGRSPGTELA